MRARLTLGATVYAPALDGRSPGQLVLGAPVVAWHEANAALLAHVVARLRDDGWSHS